MRYDQLAAHRLMIRDAPRTDAFAAAIRAVVRGGQTVLDIGAGSGILSLLAAKAGARRVFAVEHGPIAALAADLASRNNLGAIVQVIRADARAVWLPEQADVLISEWLGTIGIDENLLGMVLIARDRWLKPGGAMIPSAVAAVMAPGCLDLRPDTAFFLDRPYGLDLTPLAEPSVHELLYHRRPVGTANLMAEPARLWSHDMSRMPVRAALGPATADTEFVISRDGTVNCLIGWFEATLAPGVTLGNGPDSADTHWGQLQLPLRRQIDVAAGDRLRVRIACVPWGPGPRHFAWSVSHDDGAWEHHDTRRLAPDPPREAPRMRPSELTRFLATLAGDPAALHRFIRDPEAAMAETGMSDPLRAALRSGNEALIQQALLTTDTAP
jgi:hypothetical protein